jgi:hypothetical protein
MAMIAESATTLESHALRLGKLYYQLLDAHDHEGALALLHPDVVWFRQGVKLRGLEEVREVLATRSEGMTIRHLVLNDTANAKSSERIDINYCVVSFRHDGEAGSTAIPATPGSSVFDCVDRLARIRGAWKFIYREAIPVFLKAKVAQA